MLLFAWTFSCLVLSIFSWIAWVSWTFFRFVNSCEKVLSFCSWISFSTFRWNCNFTQIGKTYNFFANLVKNYLSSYLFVSYSSILFIRFSMNTILAADTVGWWAQTSNLSPTYRVLYALHWSASVWSLANFVRLVGSSGLEPPTSRLSGARSNHLSYEPIQFLSVYLVHSHLFLFASRLSSKAFCAWPRRLAAWWRWWESNPWPPACRAGALPAELHPHWISE